MVHTITASATAGGAISPGGIIEVEDNGTEVFNITADTGYHITDVIVDGTSYGVVN